jgi:putative phosphoesterase
MKLFFIADIHGSYHHLQRGLDCFEQEQADQIIILGDALYHGPRNPLPQGYDPPHVAPLLNQYKDRIIAVRGNCDCEVDQMLIEYPMLGDYAVVFIDSRKLFLTHGHIFSPSNPPALPPGSIFASGHTHLPVAEKRGDLYFFNPGSLTLPKGGFPNSYGIYADNVLTVKSLDGATLAQQALDD